MRFFIAGVMQGSHQGTQLHEQDYRQHIEQAVRRAFPDAGVYDPWALHRESITYDDLVGKQVFLEHNRMCGEVDVLIAYLPQASMGTAIEMWEAHRNGKIVIAITTMNHNWAVKFVSHHRFASLEAFDAAANDGSLAALVTQLRTSLSPP